MTDNLNIENVNTTPTIPLTDEQKVRFSQAADSLTNALQQGYIEASVLTQLLNIVQQVLPLFLKI